MILNAIENVHRTVYAEVFKVLNYRKYIIYYVSEPMHIF